MEDPYDIHQWATYGIPVFDFFDDDEYIPDEYMEERWKESDLPDIWVSNCGRFYNVVTQRFVNPTHGDDHGHQAVKVSSGGIRRQAYVHRLVAKEFIPNQGGLPMVRHLDDDPSNNAAENLAWGTQKDNHSDAVRNGTSYTITDEDRAISYKLSSHPVVATAPDGTELYFASQCEASRSLGIPQANIWKVINGQRLKASGYLFREVRKEEFYA